MINIKIIKNHEGFSSGDILKTTTKKAKELIALDIAVYAETDDLFIKPLYGKSKALKGTPYLFGVLK